MKPSKYFLHDAKFRIMQFNVLLGLHNELIMILPYCQSNENDICCKVESKIVFDISDMWLRFLSLGVDEG